MVVQLVPVNGSVGIVLTQDKADLYVDVHSMAGLKQLVEKIKLGEVELVASEEQEVLQNPQRLLQYFKITIVPKA